VAALTALYYGEAYPQQVAYIGLGTPRVGNEAFKQKFDSVVMDRTRIANGRDPGKFSFYAFGLDVLRLSKNASESITTGAVSAFLTHSLPAVNKVPPPVGYTHVGKEAHIGRGDPYPAIAALTDLPDHDVLKGYLHNLETPSARSSSVPTEHSNWMTEVLSKIRV